jgi:flagellar hook-length control protein FliK
MEIQSIHGSTKTTAATQAPSDEDQASTASGFAALLSMVGSQFKATLGIGMDPVVIKTDANPEPVRAPEPREAKPRAERSDEKDAKAKPAKDENADDDTQADETAAADEQNSETTDAGADAQAGQEQAAQAAVAAVVDAALITETTAAAPVVVAETIAVAAVETLSADVEAVVTEVVAADTAVKATETVVDVKAAAQTEVKTAEKVVAPEAVVKDTARVQQAISAYAPTQSADDVEAVAVEAETTTVDTKAAAKDNAVRTLDVRSAAAQEQANSLARLLGSENRIQVQVNVNAAHTAKQAVADVSIYNIYAGYSAADAISLANGQFGQTEQSPVQTQSQTQPQAPAPRANEALPQAAILPQPAQAPAPSSAQTAAPARADGLAPLAVQASTSSGGAATTNQSFSAFTQSGQSNATQQTQQAAQPNPTERPAATAQHVIDQIKVNITKAAKAGLDRVTIQLKPVELGRIEIKLEMSEDHKVRVTVTADTKDTLSLLQTDSRTLERTLNDAGLRTDANNLHFNLRSESDAQSAESQNGRGGKNGGGAANEAAGEELPSSFDYAAAAYARGGVDTFA